MKNSAIAWRHPSLNLWQECTELSSECADCYAPILTLHVEQCELHKSPHFTEIDRVFDSGEPRQCRVRFNTEEGMSFGPSTGCLLVGLKGARSFLSLSDAVWLREGKTSSPHAVLFVTISTEIIPTLRQQRGLVEQEGQSAESSPNAEELHRLVERRRAAELGYDLPLHASEAADYIGMPRAALEQLVCSREILSHPQLHLGEDGRLFYASELDEWLAAHVEPITNGATQDSVWSEGGPEDEKC